MLFFKYIAWCLKAFTTRRFHTCRHDGSDWTTADSDRRSRSGRELAFRGILLFLKGDWSEYANTIGFTPWNDILRPCLLCNSSGRDLYIHGLLSPTSFPHRLNTSEDYERACRQCEIAVTLDEQLHRVVLSALEYDKRDNGNHGRALKYNLPQIPTLRKGDRLEPCETVPDIGAFEKLSSFPVVVLFWRTSRESMTRHRNPLADPELYIKIFDIVTVDGLHCLYLGVFNTFCKIAFWAVLGSGVWGRAPTMSEQHSIAVHTFGTRLCGSQLNYNTLVYFQNLITL